MIVDLRGSGAPASPRAGPWPGGRPGGDDRRRRSRGVRRSDRRRRPGRRASGNGTSSSSTPWTIRTGRGGREAQAASGRRAVKAPAHSATSGGYSGVRTTPTRRENSSIPSTSWAQSAKVAGDPKVATPRTRWSVAARHRASAPPVPKPTSHTPPRGRVPPRGRRRHPSPRASRRARSRPPTALSPGSSRPPRTAPIPPPDDRPGRAGCRRCSRRHRPRAENRGRGRRRQPEDPTP